MRELGNTRWVIAEGYIPGRGLDDEALKSHETFCVLNAGDEDAHLEITLYFSDREPVGLYRKEVPARRTRHIRANALEDPEVPRDTDYTTVIVSDVPVVVQHTRLDSRPRVPPIGPYSPIGRYGGSCRGPSSAVAAAPHIRSLPGEPSRRCGRRCARRWR